MSTLAVCRVCLVGKIKMYSIENHKILEIYEKLLSKKLSTEDGLPKTVCYICYSQLQRCYKFCNLACQSDNKLKNLLNSSNQEVTSNSLRQPPTSLALNMIKVKNLSVTVAPPTFEDDKLDKESLVTSSGNMNENNYFCFYEETPVEIKVEIEVKEEPNSEDEGSVKSEKHTPMENISENESLVKTEKCVQIEINNLVNEGLPKAEKCTLINNGLQNKRQSRKKDVGHSSKHDSQTHSFNTTKKPYNCTKCNKSFAKTRLKYLRKHLAICSGEPTMSCTECSETFTDIDNFEAHIKAHLLDRRYICTICTKIFKSSSQLNYHLKNHTGYKPYACELCGSAFNLQSRLRIHMKSHIKGVRPFECNLCGKTYSLKGSLTQHMRSHTGERPYLCNTCGAKFGFIGSLKQHIRRLHTEVKAYACDKCHLSFNQEIGLTGHMRSHNDERSYSCDICSKTFISARNLKAHVLIHTGERPYTCNICGNTYKRSEHLKEHQKTIKCKNFAILKTPDI